MTNEPWAPKIIQKDIVLTKKICKIAEQKGDRTEIRRLSDRIWRLRRGYSARDNCYPDPCQFETAKSCFSCKEAQRGVSKEDEQFVTVQPGWLWCNLYKRIVIIAKVCKFHDKRR